MIAPAFRRRLTTPASSGTTELRRLNEPAVVFKPEVIGHQCLLHIFESGLQAKQCLPSEAMVAILSFNRIGIPCNKLRFPDFLRSLSRAAASPRAEGLVSRTARSSGPFKFTSSIRAKYA